MLPLTGWLIFMTEDGYGQDIWLWFRLSARPRNHANLLNSGTCDPETHPLKPPSLGSPLRNSIQKAQMCG